MSPSPGRLSERLRGRFTPAQGAFAGIFVVTLLGLLSVGATLPVLPRYVRGPIDAGNVSVGIVTGAFAITGLAFRPIGGHLADSRGRRRIVILGALGTATASLLYFVPAGVPGLIFARLFLGAGEGMVYTAGPAWAVDLAPPERRGRIIGLYGLAIWGGLSLGPPIGELLLQAEASSSCGLSRRERRWSARQSRCGSRRPIGRNGGPARGGGSPARRSGPGRRSPWQSSATRP